MTRCVSERERARVSVSVSVSVSVCVFVCVCKQTGVEAFVSCGRSISRVTHGVIWGDAESA
jgi:hypothetical protein